MRWRGRTGILRIGQGWGDASKTYGERGTNGRRGEGDEGRFEAEREKRNQKERQRVRGSDGEAVPTEIES